MLIKSFLLFVSVVFMCVFMSLAANAAKIECAPYAPSGYPSYSAQASGTVDLSREGMVTGRLDLVLKQNRVGHESVVHEVSNMTFEGRLETVGAAKVIHIRAQNTNKSAELDYVMLSVYPGGDKLARANGGFVRASHGFYRPHHCVLK